MLSRSVSRNGSESTGEGAPLSRFLEGVTNRAQPWRRIWPARAHRSVVIVNGHPDPRPNRFCAALSDAYAAGARAKGLQVDRIDIANLGAPSDPEWDAALARIRCAPRLVVVYPLWLDGPPAALKSFFAEAATGSATPDRAVRAIVTMDMPAFLHRSPHTSAHARIAAALDLPGVEHTEPVFIGTVAGLTAAQRADWLKAIREFGAGKRDRIH